MKRVFDRGDVVKLCLDPVSGREMRGGHRVCLVLTGKVFNRLGKAMVAPITQGGNFARERGFTVPLSGTMTQGVVVVSDAKILDLEARGARKVDTLQDHIVDDAVAKLIAILEG